MKRSIIGAVAVAAGALVLGACGSDKTQLDDAPVGIVDDSPAKILTGADSFPNIAVRCYGKNGLYSTTREGAGALKIVANDPECGGDPNFTVISG